MKSKRLMNAIGNIDDKYIEAAEPKHMTDNFVESKKFLGTWKFAAIAASLVIGVAVAAFLGRDLFWQNNSENKNVVITPDNTMVNPAVQIPAEDNSDNANSPIRGLPVEDFSLSDVQENGIAMDRNVFTDFDSIIKMGVDCLALVKVDSIRTLDDSDGWAFDHQVSNVRILKYVYGDIKSDALQISQSVIKDHFCLGSTNLLREGAVYLLPLKQSDGNWYIIGDMDVLFEVDEKGKVWSHSGYGDFNRYDGYYVDNFIIELQKLIFK